MSLDKAIEHGHEHRKPYYDSRAVDWTCRAHGGCLWCEENRTHASAMRKAASEDRIREWEREYAD